MNGELLPGGWMTHVRLVDGRVHRPLGQHSEFVHQLLGFLEAVGFEGAPRLVGVVDDEEVLTYIEGHVPVEHPRHVEPIVFSDVGVETVFRMIRRLHDVTAGSQLSGEDETVCHGDLSPWNTVYDSHGATSLIDLDNAAPGPRFDDVGFATWRFLRLGLPDAPPIDDQRRQLRLIARTYGEWTPADLLELAASAQSRHRRVFEERQAARDPKIDHLIELGALDYIDNARRWLDQHASELR
jgi:Phosphotransferase enzyme family